MQAVGANEFINQYLYNHLELSINPMKCFTIVFTDIIIIIVFITT